MMAMATESGPVRCAVHTLQLAIHDIVDKDHDMKVLLTKVKKIVNKTHSHNMRLTFSQNLKPLPRLDCETR